MSVCRESLSGDRSGLVVCELEAGHEGPHGWENGAVYATRMLLPVLERIADALETRTSTAIVSHERSYPGDCAQASSANPGRWCTLPAGHEGAHESAPRALPTVRWWPTS